MWYDLIMLHNQYTVFLYRFVLYKRGRNMITSSLVDYYAIFLLLYISFFSHFLIG